MHLAFFYGSDNRMNARSCQFVGRLTLAVFACVTLCGELLHHRCSHAPGTHQHGLHAHAHEDEHVHVHVPGLESERSLQFGGVAEAPLTGIAPQHDCAICAVFATGFVAQLPAVAGTLAATGALRVTRSPILLQSATTVQRSRAPPFFLS